MKAADIPENVIFDVIEKRKYRNLGAGRWEFESALPQFPPKVILAKLRQMLKKNAIVGCGCGCRGDFLFSEQTKKAAHPMGGPVPVPGQ